MPDQTLDEEIVALKTRAADEFSESCLEGARRALADHGNPLRLNFFAAAMRMLFERLLDTLAPIDEVVRAGWFKSEQKSGRPTRSQRIVYAIQGGLSETFMAQELHVDPHPLRKRLLEAFDECSTRVHEREHNVIAEPDKQEVVAEAILATYKSLFDTIRDCRAAVIEPIVEALDEAAVDALLTETILEVDELATHHSVQEVYVDNTKVQTIGPDTITYRSTGSVDVVLQFGSDSDLRNDMGAEIEQTFPFVCDITIPLSEPWNLEWAEPRYGVDVSKWRDAMRPDDFERDDIDD
jgi:Predicted pPIWI-associating nuclease